MECGKLILLTWCPRTWIGNIRGPTHCHSSSRPQARVAIMGQGSVQICPLPSPPPGRALQKIVSDINRGRHATERCVDPRWQVQSPTPRPPRRSPGARHLAKMQMNAASARPPTPHAMKRDVICFTHIPRIGLHRQQVPMERAVSPGAHHGVWVGKTPPCARLTCQVTRHSLPLTRPNFTEAWPGMQGMLSGRCNRRQGMWRAHRLDRSARPLTSIGPVLPRADCRSISPRTPLCGCALRHFLEFVAEERSTEASLFLKLFLDCERETSLTAAIFVLRGGAAWRYGFGGLVNIKIVLLFSWYKFLRHSSDQTDKFVPVQKLGTDWFINGPNSETHFQPQKGNLKLLCPVPFLSGRLD
jgi:hypothetical protein